MGSALALPSSRNSAFFDNRAACSKVPPTPTPAMSGGQASGPAVLMHSRIHALTPSTPSAGVSILYLERFSHPPPLAMIWILSVAPATRSRWITAGVLSPVFTRSKGDRTMDARRYPSV